MAIQLEWIIPDSTRTDFDYTYIYRSDTETGTYTNIANVAIATNYYFDIDGGNSDWYKIRYYKSDTGEWSAYSTAMQGAKWYGYCTVNDVRDITNLTTSCISDTELYKLIKHAMYRLNSDINVHETRERIWYLDRTRENKIDGVNTTYYVKNWKGKYIADSDNDGDVDTSDITVYQVDSEGDETELTVSSITPNDGKFVLSSAPASGVELYVTYHWSYVSEYDPHYLVVSACAHLTAALAYEKVNTGKSPQAVFGNVRFYRDMKASNIFFKTYMNIINQINNRMIDWKESKEIV